MRLEPKNPQSYPLNPGVYRMTNAAGTIIYIGKAKNLRNRLKTYFDSSSKSPRIQRMITEIDHIEVTTTNSENDALILEQKLINKNQPKYNVIFRDDKSYPFIALSKHEYPKIYISREKSTKTNKENLFGPYPRADDAYKNIEYIQKFFKIRTCSDSEFANRSRPCILHSIGKCTAPCVNKDNQEFKDFYTYNINQAKKVLKGQVAPTIKSLEEKMQEHSGNFEFEKAAQLRDTIKALKDLTNNQTILSTNEENLLIFNYIQKEKTYVGYTKVTQGLPQEIFHRAVPNEMKDFPIEDILTKYVEQEVDKIGLMKIIVPMELPELFYEHKFTRFSKQETSWAKLVYENLNVILQEDLRKEDRHHTLITRIQEVFNIPIYSIDCIDISHFNGEATYGGKIRWTLKMGEGELDKPFYRLSRFPGQVIDDVSRIHDTVEKIYHNDNDMPTILIVDGDMPQMEAAYEALKEKNLEKNYILLCSAKGSTRKKGVEIVYAHPSTQQFIYDKYLLGNVLNLPKENLVRILIQHLQDTAHNFSNSARKKQMTKTRFKPKKKENGKKDKQNQEK